MAEERNDEQGRQTPVVSEGAGLARDRRVQWAKYDAMMSSVRAACARHLEIIHNEQVRADEELATRRRAGATQ